jgi:integrase
VKTPGLRKGRRPGEWHLEVCVPGTGGRVRKRRTIFADSRAEALHEWSIWRKELVARGGRARVWTLRAYVEAHAEAFEARYTTHGARDFAFRCSVLIRELGDIRLDRVTAATVRDLAARLQGRYKPSTVNAMLTGLRRLLRDAVDRSELAVYPIRGRLPLQRVEPLRLELSDEERVAFLAGFDDAAKFRRVTETEGPKADVMFSFHRALRPLFIVALETGLARGDLLSLTWADVAGPVIRRPRGKTHVEAVIPVSTTCRAALEELRARPLVGKRVFVSPLSGRPLAIDTLEVHFRLAKRIAGITRRLRFHDLRHTFASRLASRGVSLQVIARALGHSSIAMSQRYARPDEAAMRAVLDALGGSAANVSANNRTHRNGGN